MNQELNSLYIYIYIYIYILCMYLDIYIRTPVDNSILDNKQIRLFAEKKFNKVFY